MIQGMELSGAVGDVISLEPWTAPPWILVHPQWHSGCNVRLVSDILKGRWATGQLGKRLQKKEEKN